MTNFGLVLAKENGLLEKCHAIVNAYYFKTYGIQLGKKFDFKKKLEPYPTNYFVAIKGGAIMGCCGVYDHDDVILRFQEDKNHLDKILGCVEITKLVVIQKFRNQKIGTLLTAVSFAHYIQSGKTIILHASDLFIRKIIAILQLKYEVLIQYPAGSHVTTMYSLDNVFLLRICPAAQ
jgi:hypothetical protein